MLKQKIAKAEFDALPDVMKPEYKVSATNAGEYLLDTDDASAAITARDREKARADQALSDLAAANARIAAADAAVAAATAEAARKAGDIPALEASWQAKLDKAVSDAKAAQDAANAQLRTLLVRNKATEIANQISTVPSLLVSVIEQRLTADLTGETPITRVLDANGKPSALSLAELSQEFVANPTYATIIKASDGSGGGAGGQGTGGGAPGKKLSEMTERERVAYSQADPAGFKRATEAQRTAK